MRRITVVALLLCVLSGYVAIAQDAQPQTVMIPMRDGVRLATDIYLPEDEGAWPVMLSRTPYGRTRHREGARTPNRQVRVIQDMRGRFDSEGTDTLFLTDGHGELQDGYDTIEWLADQQWCDGHIGTVGGSAGGITQYMAASSAPPHLSCCTPQVATPSLYHYAAYPGGVLRKAMVETWLTNNEFDPQNLQRVYENPSYNEMWEQVDMLAVAEEVNVPMIHRGGWWDCFQGGNIAGFEALQERGAEGALGKQFLIMGPWVHGCRVQGELEFPQNAARSPFQSMRDFRMEYLYGQETGIQDRPHAYYYVMGACGEADAPGNFWRSTDTWPPEAERTPLYLWENGGMSTNIQPTNSSLSYEYDPADPVPTVGGANLVLPKGPADQREVERRDDVAVFTTGPVQQPMEVTGHIRAILRVSTDAPDTDFSVRLTDVYPDGRSMLLCDGIRRLRYHQSFEQPHMVPPGEIVELEVDLWSTSIVFNAGHSIRVAVTSSNYPRFSANPNTGAPRDDTGETHVAVNTIYFGGEDGSRIILPVVADAEWSSPDAANLPQWLRPWSSVVAFVGN